MMTQQLIRVGHSPDPDDAFMFHALANDKIVTGNLKFVHELQDIETLNRRALKGELEVTAVSIHAYSFLRDKYGPMIVARKPFEIADLPKIKIAVPGTLTTAFLTLKLLMNGAPFEFDVIPFDEIIPAVAAGKYEAGLIIHEGQLTFQNQG